MGKARSVPKAKKVQAMSAIAEHGHVYDTIIVGGGQAGLATAYYLRKHTDNYLILDDQTAPGGAWRHVWPSMTLFSTAAFSNLPGFPMPAYDGFPGPGHVIDYLNAYERRYGLPIRRPLTVEAVDRAGELFTVTAFAPETSGPGEVFYARSVIAATGTWSAPFVPRIRGSYHGRQWHSAHYPGVEPFVGATVAVVGAANSGAQIAAELLNEPRVGEVTWYTRHAPRYMPDEIDGRALFHRNRVRALAIARGEPDPGADSNLGDIVVLPGVKAARDAGRLVPTPMFSDVGQVTAEHLIWCTGFRPALGPFRRLIRHREATCEGLYFVGYGDWVGPGAATITGVGPYAKRAATAVATLLGLS